MYSLDSPELSLYHRTEDRARNLQFIGAMTVSILRMLTAA
jgi:hypothetical protein